MTLSSERIIRLGRPVSSTRIERRLAAVLAVDVAGYSRLMGADEVGTLEALKAHRREVVDSTITSHRGRIVKTTGDGMLVEFASAVDAVTCAMAIQEKMAERNAGSSGPNITFRVGINVGDIIIDGDDIFGDGVNVAARVENECEPGGVYISANAFEQVRSKTPFTFADLGERTLKNIDRPVRVYATKLTDLGTNPPVVLTSAPDTKKPLPLPDKPSIAVLPFNNMSGDPEQDYFADGVVEDIITALSHFKALFVIARNSSFTYKGRAVDVKQVGRDLGVRYVLEGSVRKAANRVRITGQLIDASNGVHIWADRMDGGLDDIFDLQDQVTASVVGAIAPAIEKAEIDRAKRKPTESLYAYDYYLLGIAATHSVFEGTEDAVGEALRLFYRAIELDPNYAAAYGMAAWCHVLRKNYGWVPNNAQANTEVERLARQAARLAKNDAVALYTAGFALARVLGQLDAGAALMDRALELEPNLAAAWHLSGWMKIYLGEPEMAIEHLAQAMRLNPLDPLILGMQNGTAAAHFLAGRYDAASSWAEKALQQNSNYLPAIRMAAASHALSGRLAQGQSALARMREIDPELRISNLAELVPFRAARDIARYLEGLRQAGLPE
jgi:TolB-like protein/class 3 adenylate cyclase